MSTIVPSLLPVDPLRAVPVLIALLAFTAIPAPYLSVARPDRDHSDHLPPKDGRTSCREYGAAPELAAVPTPTSHAHTIGVCSGQVTDVPAGLRNTPPD